MKKIYLILILLSINNIFGGGKNMSIHKNDNGTYSMIKNNMELKNRSEFRRKNYFLQTK
jgi:hypothetical protein